MTDDQDDDDREGYYDDGSLSRFPIKHMKLEYIVKFTWTDQS